MNRAEKQAVIDELSAQVQTAAIIFAASSDRLTVRQSMELRRKLRQAGAQAKVVKNKLGRLSVQKAFGGQGNAGEVEKFVGALKQPTLVVVSKDDPVGPAKVLTDFANQKEIQGKFTVKGAYFEGSFMSGSQVEALSKMPGRKEILASLLRVIGGPATQLVRLLNAPGEQTVRVLEAQRKKIAGE